MFLKESAFWCFEYVSEKLIASSNNNFDSIQLTIYIFISRVHIVGPCRNENASIFY